MLISSCKTCSLFFDRKSEASVSDGARRFSKLLLSVHHEDENEDRVKVIICWVFINSNFVLRYCALFSIYICSILSRLLIEVDFYVLELDLSTLLEYKVCAFQAWRWSLLNIKAAVFILNKTPTQALTLSEKRNYIKLAYTSHCLGSAESSFKISQECLAYLSG